MATPIEIGVGVNGKALRDGVEKDIIKPIEDAEKALKDLGKSGDGAGDDIDSGITSGEKALKDLGKSSDRTADDLDKVGKAGDKSGDKIEDALESAQKESDRTRRELDDLGDAISKAGSRGKDLDDGIRKGTSGASEAVAEFGDEARSNIAETFSSFRGEGEDLVQVVQDTLGGVVGALGPVGMIAGAAGAAGIGLMLGAFEEAKEKEAEFRERVSGLAETLMETGGEGAEAIESIAAELRELAAPTDEGAQSLAELRKQAKNAETSYEALAQAYAGNADGLDEIIKKEREALEAMDNRGSRRSKTMRAEIGDRREIVATLEETARAVEEAEKAEAAWSAAGGPALEAKAAAMDTLQGELDATIDTWSDYYNAETGATDPAAYMAAMQQRIDATSSFSANVATLAEATGLSMEEAQLVLDQGVDFAPMLADIVAGGDESMTTYAGLIQQIMNGGQEIVDGMPLSSTVEVDANTDPAKSKLDTAAEDRDSAIKVDAKPQAASKQIDDAAAKKRTATINAKASTADATRALNALTRRRSAMVSASAATHSAERALTYLARPRTAIITADVRDREGKPVKP